MIEISKGLFWDIKFKDLSYKKHADFIIKRVLQYGNEKDYKIIKGRYGTKKIKKVAQNTSYSDKKSPNFWKFIFNL